MQTLIPHAIDGLLASVARSVMPDAAVMPHRTSHLQKDWGQALSTESFRVSSTYHDVLLARNPDEPVAWVLLLGDTEAGSARVKIRTIQALVPVAFDPRITKVARRVMHHGRPGCWYRRSGGRDRGRPLGAWTARSPSPSLPLACTTVYCVHNHTTRFMNLVELVERIVELHNILYATRAKIVVCVLSSANELSVGRG